MGKHLVVVTGASSGVGYALAAELAHRGHEVLAIARRQSLLEQLASSHANIEYLAADVANADDRQKIIGHLQQRQQPIYLVHNAAVVKPNTLEKLTEAEWQQALQINLEAPLWLTQACLPFFDRSRVLNISSGLAHQPLSGLGAYCLTKSALHMLYQMINEDMDAAKVIAGSATRHD